MNRSLKSPQKPLPSVYKRYQGIQRRHGNVVRLWTLARLFRLSASEVGKATGYSRSYVARLLSPRDDFNGSPEFWRTLECKLGTIIDQRASQVFTCPAISVARARGVLEGMTEPVEEMARAA